MVESPAMSTPPPVPPEMPEIPPVPGAVSGPPPVPPAPAQSYPPVPPLYPSGPPPVSYPPVVSPQSTPGGGTRGLLYGCLALLAVVGIIAVIGGVWVFKKAKGIAENPEQFIAEMAVKANPDLELIKVDNVAREVVIKDKKSGESTTFSFDEVKNGKLTMKKSDGSSAEVGAEGIRVKDKDGSEAVIGGGAAVPLPEWVPPYPGSHQVMVSSHKIKGINQSGQYAFSTGDSMDTVASSYSKTLEAAEFAVVQESTGLDRDKLITLEATATLDGGGSERISVRVTGQGRKTMVHLDYSHQEPGAGESLEK